MKKREFWNKVYELGNKEVLIRLKNGNYLKGRLQRSKNANEGFINFYFNDGRYYRYRIYYSFVQTITGVE